MSNQSRTTSPIVQFLGEDAGVGGPFALLGLGHAIQSDEQIRKAALRRLRQIDCHPQRATPDAEEARLAVHSATSQLLDPTLREHLVNRWPEGKAVDLPKAWKTGQSLQRITPALIRRARLLVGASGGWNSKARLRLAHLARVNRLSAVELVSQFGVRSYHEDRKKKTSQRFESLPDLPAGPIRGLSWGIAYCLLGVLGSGVMVSILLSPRMNQHTQGELLTSLPSESNVFQPTESVPSTVQRERLTHYTAIAHELDRLVARVRTEPDESIERFREIYPQFTAEWVSFPPAALKRAGINIAEFVTRLERQSIAPERVSPLLAVASVEPKRSMIASSMIDLTLGSPTIGVDTRAQLRAIRMQMSSSPITPNTDLHTSLVNVASGLSKTQDGDDPEWWASWLEGATRASNNIERTYTTLLIDALSQRLRDQTFPTDQWRQTAQMLVRELSWREGSQERYWLISQFSDSNVTTPRLAILTNALANHSAADRVDQLMVLVETANDPQRELLLNLYQDRWFPEQRQQDPSKGTQPNSRLSEQIRVRVNAVGDRIDDREAAVTIVELTRLTTAASLLLDGRDALHDEVMQLELDVSADSPGVPSLDWDIQDDEWATGAVNVENAAQARPILGTLSARDQIGVSSAQAIVKLSLSKESELSQLALTHVTRYASQLPMLIAVENALVRRTVSARLEQLIDATLQVDLPSRMSPEWKSTVRRELKARIANAIALENHRSYSRLQSKVARLLEFRSGADRGQSLQTMLSRESLTYMQAIAQQPYQSPLTDTNLQRAQSKAMVLRARASTSLQVYLAEQRFVFDLLYIQTESRYPDLDYQLSEIYSTYETRFAGSTSAIQQIAQTERAIASVLQHLLDRSSMP